MYTSNDRSIASLRLLFPFCRDLRVKRKRKRLLQEQQQAKEMEEKFDEKLQEKVKSETDEDTKDTIGAMDDECQGGDSSESKAR